MCIETYGKGERLRCAAGMLSESAHGHLVLLPVPSTKDDKNVFNTDIPLQDTLVNVGANSLVVGYLLPVDYREDVTARGGRVLDLGRDEKFLIDNAILTALGTVGFILTTERRAPEDIRFGVVGYGRIGAELVKTLLFFGARVRVYSSRPSTRMELCALGVESADTEQLKDGRADFSELDILINTAPADFRAAFSGGSLPIGLRVIELASGNNFDGVSGVERLPALPERAYPDSAARAYADSVRRYINVGGDKI